MTGFVVQAHIYIWLLEYEQPIILYNLQITNLHISLYFILGNFRGFLNGYKALKKLNK